LNRKRVTDHHFLVVVAAVSDHRSVIFLESSRSLGSDY
jgi:hypothetical protein